MELDNSTYKRIIIFAVLVIVIGAGIIFLPNIIQIHSSLIGNPSYTTISSNVLLIYSERNAMGGTTTTIKIYNNGKTETLHDNKVVESFNMNKTGITTIKNTITKVKFMELNKDVTDPNVMDGSYNSITVNINGQIHTSKGYNPSNKSFCKLQDTVIKVLEKQSGGNLLQPFSFDGVEEEANFWKSDGRKVKTVGFKNTNPVEIKNKIDAIERAKKELTIKYSQVQVAYDYHSSMWDVDFDCSTENTYYNVAVTLSKDGITKLIVYEYYNFSMNSTILSKHPAFGISTYFFAKVIPAL